MRLRDPALTFAGRALLPLIGIVLVGVLRAEPRKPMLGDDGKPRPELFRSDGLHMSKAGYKLWANLLRPHFKLD